MKTKSPAFVYFLDSVNTQEEYNLIHGSHNVKSNGIKVSGNSLQISDTQLMITRERKYVDYYYSKQNQKSVFVSLMLISSHPFVNLLEKAAEIIVDFNQYPYFYNFYNLLKNKESINIDKYISYEQCEDIKEGYVYVLRSLHQELVKNMRFEEVTWAQQKKRKK